MSLFELIYMATVEQNVNAVWEIILRFEPLLDRVCMTTTFNKVDEDLKSEMRLVLFKRIQSFRIMEQ